jgi:hypothetical protein
MPNGEEKSNYFYQVLALEKECSAMVRIGKLNFITSIVSKPFIFFIN